MNNTIFFSEYTEKYTSGLPMGNGTLAAMVLGTPQKTRLALNHEALWRTFDKDREVPDRAERTQKIRSFIEKNEYEKATLEAHDAYSRYSEGSSRRIMPYVPAGDLNILLDTLGISSYKRSLDITTGEVKIEFDSEKCGRAEISTFISAKKSLGFIKIITEKDAEPTAELFRAEDASCSYEIKRTNGRDELWGALDGELFFLVAVNHKRISPKFTLMTFGIDVGSAKEKLYVSSEMPDYEAAFAEHREEFSSRLGDSEIILDLPEKNDTTDKRIAALGAEEDASLPQLFFNFAKYLMASSSGRYPSNLQGKWNEEIIPPWSCDYHLDINLQMNYWITGVLGMDYANEALFDWLESCVPFARERAKKLYGCRGICFDHAADLYGAMFHDAYGWGAWLGSAPWLAQHFYRHYLYTEDVDFLRDRAYPFMSECLDFYEDLTFMKDGKLCISPSTSPENRFVGAGELPISICENSAMDISLYRELLIYAIEASNVLGIDDSRWQRLLSLTPELKIGSDGRLLEWDKEYREAEPEHRHLSHLVGFYPGWLIEKESDLGKACKKSLDFRLSFGGGQTGWSRAWVACLYARMGRGTDLWESIKNLITEQCSPSLLDFHPPMGSYSERIFQIDGNFGGAAAIAEAFVSVRFDEITLLGALPDKWKNGSVKHFKLPHDTDISFDFKNGRLTKIEIFSTVPHEIKLIHPEGKMNIFLNKNEKYILSDF